MPKLLLWVTARRFNAQQGVEAVALNASSSFPSEYRNLSTIAQRRCNGSSGRRGSDSHFFVVSRTLWLPATTASLCFASSDNGRIAIVRTSATASPMGEVREGRAISTSFRNASRSVAHSAPARHWPKEMLRSSRYCCQARSRFRRARQAFSSVGKSAFDAITTRTSASSWP